MDVAWPELAGAELELDELEEPPEELPDELLLEELLCDWLDDWLEDAGLCEDELDALGPIPLADWRMEPPAAISSSSSVNSIAPAGFSGNSAKSSSLKLVRNSGSFHARIILSRSIHSSFTTD
jgi:hypothetical protein